MLTQMWDDNTVCMNFDKNSPKKILIQIRTNMHVVQIKLPKVSFTLAVLQRLFVQ